MLRIFDRGSHSSTNGQIMSMIDRVLLPYPTVDFRPVRAGDGNGFPPDMDLVISDLIDLVYCYRKGAMHAEEVFGRKPGGYVGKGLMTEIFACRGDHAYIIFQAFDVKDSDEGDPYPLPVGAEKKGTRLVRFDPFSLQRFLAHHCLARQPAGPFGIPRGSAGSRTRSSTPAPGGTSR